MRQGPAQHGVAWPGEPRRGERNGAVEKISTVPRPHCEHDWQITGYSHVAPSRDPYDRPEFVYYRCRKCGEEQMDDFQ